MYPSVLSCIRTNLEWIKDVLSANYHAALVGPMVVLLFLLTSLLHDQNACLGDLHQCLMCVIPSRSAQNATVFGLLTADVIAGTLVPASRDKFKALSFATRCTPVPASKGHVRVALT